MRPALVPTAVADVLTGAIYGGGAPFLPILGACAGSACIYMGAMVLNDLADRDKDAYLNPHRPLVLHPRLSAAAWAAVLILFLLGLFFTAWAGIGTVGAIVAGLAILYNLLASKRFPADVITMGAARAANLSMGLVLAGFIIGSADGISLLLGYGAYIGGITAASRTEDFKSDRARRKGVAFATIPMVIGIGAIASLAPDAGAASLFLLPLGPILVLLLLCLKSGDKPSVKRFVKYSLLGIYVIHACLLWSRTYHISAGVMVALAVFSIWLMRVLGSAATSSTFSDSPSGPHPDSA